jgi:hypothetical protein
MSTANLANKWLDMFAGTAFTAPTTVYVKLHTGDPGPSAALAASANTTRAAVTWSAASAGSKAMSGTLSWASWASGTETISHISIWDASTAGNFLWSGALTASKTVNNGDTLQITSLSLSLTPLAA